MPKGSLPARGLRLVDLLLSQFVFLAFSGGKVDYVDVSYSNMAPLLE